VDDVVPDEVHIRTIVCTELGRKQDALGAAVTGIRPTIEMGDTEI
jgi:hypothetical protein